MCKEVTQEDDRIKHNEQSDVDIKISGDKYKYYLPTLKIEQNIPYVKHANMSFDRQLSNLPKEIRYCKKCVISNQRPRITFDEKGVCSACNYAEYKKKHIDWEKRKGQFNMLLNKYRCNDGRHDVIVPCSGGKDSGSIAHKLKNEYGMNPLCVNWSPLLYTDVGMRNWENMLLSGLDGHLFAPDKILQRKLARLCFVLQGDHFEPFSRGQMAYPLHVAIKEEVKLIMWGENAELEYGGDIKNRDLPYNPIEDWDRFYNKNISFNKLLKTGLELGYLNEKDLKNPSLKWYSTPSIEMLKKSSIESRWFAWYFDWAPQENYYYVSENYGFQAMPRRSEGTYSKYASLDDLTDPQHYYMSLIKFGIGRTTSDAAHEIRDGHLTREEGVALVRKYDQEFPGKYFREFLRYIDMTEKDYWNVIDAYRSVSPYLWERTNSKWVLRHQVS